MKTNRGNLPSGEAQRLKPLPWGDPGEVRRIAVVRPGQLGDLLLATPGLRALRYGYPAAEITLIAQPWAEGIAERFRWVDRVLPLRERPSDRDPDTGSALAGFLHEARAHHYDLALQLQGDDPTFARFALSLGARATVGYCADPEIGQDFHLLLSMSPTEPEIFRMLRPVHALGIAPAGAQLEFPQLPRDLEELRGIAGLADILRRRPLIAIHPGARAPARRWPLDRFLELATLLQEHQGASLLIVGGAEEADLGRELCNRTGERGLNLAGRLSLGGLAALLRQVELFVGNDSGPAQLAVAVAPRSLRIFGPANRYRWAPLDQNKHRMVYRQVECSPCNHFECPINHRCVERITIEDVMSEIEALLASEPSSTWRVRPTS